MPIDVDGPRVRLGVAWATVALVAVLAGPASAAAAFAAVALGAAGQACRAWRRSRRRPYRPVAIGGAVLVAVAGAVGPVAVAAAALVAGVAAVAVAQVRVGGRDWDRTLTAAIALVVGAGAAAVPVVRGELGATAALVLLLTVFVAEASTFVVGSGARTTWDAPIAAMAAVGALSLGVAAVLVPPFRGSSPWALGALSAVTVPLGPRLASTLLPRARAFAPALRRIDGFFVTAPVWAVVARVMLDVP
ncbi:MAG TPA: hypothetical protein VF230_07645 [Acidimicrobiales bacterium]